MIALNQIVINVNHKKEGIRIMTEKELFEQKKQREIEGRVFPLYIQAKDYFENGENEKGWEAMLATINEFPEPKYEHDLLYLMLTEMAKFALQTNEYHVVKDYLSLFFITGLTRLDIGEREALVGKIEYELGHMETAKQLLKVALAKRQAINYFKGKENEKYLKLAKEK